MAHARPLNPLEILVEPNEQAHPSSRRDAEEEKAPGDPPGQGDAQPGQHGQRAQAAEEAGRTSARRQRGGQCLSTIPTSSNKSIVPRDDNRCVKAG